MAQTAFRSEFGSPVTLSKNSNPHAASFPATGKQGIGLRTFCCASHEKPDRQNIDGNMSRRPPTAGARLLIGRKGGDVEGVVAQATVYRYGDGGRAELMDQSGVLIQACAAVQTTWSAWAQGAAHGRRLAHWTELPVRPRLSRMVAARYLPWVSHFFVPNGVNDKLRPDLDWVLPVQNGCSRGAELSQARPLSTSARLLIQHPHPS